MKYIIGASVGWLVAWVFILSQLSARGDMNNDGVLDIKDLSILASTINEQG